MTSPHAGRPGRARYKVADLWTSKPERALSVLLFAVFITVWEALIRWLDVPALVVPAPSAVARSLYAGFRSGVLVDNTLVTFTEVILGFIGGSLLGLLLGAVVSQFSLLEKTVYPYIVAFQTIPKIAIAPIIVMWFGFGMTSKVIIAAAIAFFPLLANTIAGLRSAPSDQVELLVAFTASRWQIFRIARIPQALPYIFVGLDVAIVLSIIGAIAGEFVGAQGGLGYLILQRNFTMDMAGVFAVLVVLSCMGIGLHLIVRSVQRRVVFWIDNDQDQVAGA
jgi:NitT/TauT family transport system permease protein